jgi:general secretion pathway protein F
MPDFRYQALTQNGEEVSGSISAASAAEVAVQMDYLRLMPIGAIVEDRSASSPRSYLGLARRARPQDITIFTSDLALLLTAGARLDEALELLSTDIDIGRMHSTVSAIRSSVLAGETFADALAHHPLQFPPIYVALVRVGESSGTLNRMLQLLGKERARSEALRRKLADALRYPAFLLFAAAGVLLFFLLFVLPQFAGVLRDFGADIDPTAKFFIHTSEFVAGNKDTLGLATALSLLVALLVVRQQRWRSAAIAWVARLPVVRTVAEFYRTALFCRNLAVLLGAAVPLTSTLKILADILRATGHGAVWDQILDRVRHGGKLSDSIAANTALPTAAIRMLRLGEETGQLPLLAGRVAEFYEMKLQRSTERVVGLIGPLAIVTISVIIGGLIISVMTSLLSVSQLVG